MLILAFVLTSSVSAAPPFRLGPNDATWEQSAFPISPSTFLAAGHAAEKEKRWDVALTNFRLYLLLDSTSDIASKVREEVENIQWRVQFLKSPAASQLLEQQREEEDARQLLALGFPADAARKALEMIGRRPLFWQNYFIASAAFQKMGDFASARLSLEMGAPCMDSIQKSKAAKMAAHIDKQESLAKKLSKANELLKQSRASEAAELYVQVAAESPANLSYRQLAIQAYILAENYTYALRLVADPVELPDGSKKEIPKPTRDKLIADISALQKLRQKLGSNAQKPTAANSSKTAPAKPAKKAGSSSMADDFLKRIKK